MRLSEAVTARDAFLAVAAHELGNPMTPIALRLHLLRRLNETAQVPNAQIAQSIDEMEKSVVTSDGPLGKRSSLLLGRKKFQLKASPVLWRPGRNEERA